MPDRFYKVLTYLLSSTLLLFSLAAQAQSDTWYRVEMLIFSHPGGGGSEEWEATPTLAYPASTKFLSEPDSPMASSPPAAPVQPRLSDGAAEINSNPLLSTSFNTLPSSALEFLGAASQMQRSGRYRPLFHKAWMQPIGGQSAAHSIVLDESGNGGQWPELQGSIKLYVSGYLYLETNLWLNTSGEYLQGSWRMPPPPLGPATTVVVEEYPQSEPGPEPGSGSVPQYPYRHAVLLDQTLRMRSSEVNYIDHPMYGVVVKITPLAAAEPGSMTDQSPQPEVSDLEALEQ